MKNNRSGQAEILSDGEILRIYKALISPSHKLFFNIARYTGERFGAICQLQVCDVFVCLENSGLREVKEEITFRAATRKKSGGDRSTRQLPVADKLAEYLNSYRGEMGEVWLFESKIKPGQCITWSSADKWFRAAVDRAGLSHRGISGHSLRRTFITGLYRSGVDLKLLQQITGHKDIKSLMLYIGVDKADVRKALNNGLG